MRKARAKLSDADCEQLVLNLFEKSLLLHLENYIAEHRTQIIRVVENLWDKYRVTLGDIEIRRNEAREKLKAFTATLGYI
jgi:type I restriction enzyme M protein